MRWVRKKLPQETQVRNTADHPNSHQLIRVQFQAATTQWWCSSKAIYRTTLCTALERAHTRLAAKTLNRCKTRADLRRILALIEVVQWLAWQAQSLDQAKLLSKMETCTQRRVNTSRRHHGSSARPNISTTSRHLRSARCSIKVHHFGYSRCENNQGYTEKPWRIWISN